MILYLELVSKILQSNLQVENGEVLDIDFSKDIDEWKDALVNESDYKFPIFTYTWKYIYWLGDS